MYKRQGNTTKALGYYQQAIRVYGKAKPRDLDGLLGAADAAAQLHMDAGRRDPAVRLLRRVLRAFRREADPQDYRQAFWVKMLERRIKKAEGAG